MGLAIFYETLLVILVSALTAAVCLSSYLVTKRKTMLFACIAFMFYFFDVASILQDDYAARELASGLTQEYYFIRSLYTMVTGAGFLCESRGLNKTLVEAFLLSGDIYEYAKRHNVVFVGRDRNGTPRYAHVRGTADTYRQDNHVSVKS